MFHKNAVRFTNPISSASTPDNLHLMPSVSTDRPARTATHLDLLIITSRRCSAFFAEAAVLVLVFGLLDYFMLKGRIELAWILLAIGASLTLLAASIATDFAAHHWVKAHP
ncbi:MAG TPA: hypothetical protein VK814_06015 [Acidobacteriaceae bacterium]|nr:hypothetical protein [Acidobacteriaceae bacterium]